MKMERLNDNKIKIILNVDDLLNNHIDLQTFLSNTPQSNQIFLDLLDKAEAELNFITDNYKLMIK